MDCAEGLFLGRPALVQAGLAAGRPAGRASALVRWPALALWGCSRNKKDFTTIIF